MLIVDHQLIVNAMGKYAKQALEDAASLCISQSAYEVTIEHWLHTAMKMPASDIIYILRHFPVVSL